ncbi:MAG: amidase [Chloroflexota bacterium]
MTTPISAWQIRHLIATRQLSPVELTREVLERAEAANSTLHSLLTICGDEALEAAKVAEAHQSSGAFDRPLLGVPFTAKDVFPTQGVRTTFGSLLFADQVPEHDAALVKRMKNAGAILIGKGNTSEFALFWRTMNKLADECVNPWNTAHVAGGSSGGDAASVAGGIVPVALGSDRGGSGRIPASWCGVYALQGTFGSMSSEGVAETSMYSGVAPITASIRDMRLVHGVLTGVVDGRPKNCRGMRLGWSSAVDEGVEIHPSVLECCLRALGNLAAEGFSFTEVPWPRDSSYRDAYWLLNDADRNTFLGGRIRSMENWADAVCDYVFSRLEHGREVTTDEVCRALLLRVEYQQRMSRIFTSVDVVLTPTVAILAPPVSASLRIERGAVTGFTWPVNFGDICALTVPIGVVDGLPVGMQVLGSRGRENWMLAVAEELERLCGVGLPVQQ